MARFCLVFFLLVAYCTRLHGFILPGGISSLRSGPALRLLTSALRSSAPDNSNDPASGGDAEGGLPAELFGPLAPGILYVNSGDGEVDSDGSSLFPALDKQSAEDSLALLDAAGRDKGPRRIIEIGLLPFEGPLFPKAREFLFIFEMRYRLLLNHVEERAHGHRYLGRCYYNAETDEIGAVGSLCRIVESRKLMDGKGFFVIEARSRFRIRRILSRSPYIRAEVELDWADKESSAAEAHECHATARSVYGALKQYLRITRIAGENNYEQHDDDDEEDEEEDEESEDEEEEEEEGERGEVRGAKYDGGYQTQPFQDQQGDNDEEEEEGENTAKYITLTPSVRDSRPLPPAVALATPAPLLLERCEKFSYAVANLLSRNYDLMQRLLQTRSTLVRLQGLGSVLSDAIEEMGSVLVEDGVLSRDALGGIREMSNDVNDDDSALMPPADLEGMTIASEMEGVDVSYMLESFGVSREDYYSMVGYTLIAGSADDEDDGQGLGLGLGMGKNKGEGAGEGTGGSGGVGGGMGGEVGGAEGAGVDPFDDPNAFQ